MEQGSTGPIFDVTGLYDILNNRALGNGQPTAEQRIQFAPISPVPHPPGSAVEYFSVSKKRWVPAIVESFGDGFYTLDATTNVVPQDMVRPSQTQAPQIAPYHSVQVAPGQLAASGLSHSPSQAQSFNGSGASGVPLQSSVAIPPGALMPNFTHAAAGAISSSAPASKYVPPEVPNVVPLASGVERIEPEVVQQLLQQRACVLVDVRGEDRCVGLIPGAICEPAIDSTPFYQKLPVLVHRFQRESLVVFTCQYSAHRAPQCANWYREQAEPRQRVAILNGGFRAWEGHGLPVESGGGDSGAADAYALKQGAQFAMMNGTAPNAPKCAAALYAQIRG
jgi:rhodanese-related sulfurtransferase